MTKPFYGVDPETFAMDDSESRALGESLHQDYIAAEPFPHIVIDNFLPEEILDRCLRGFPELDETTDLYRSLNQNLKVGYIPDGLPLETRVAFQFLNSRPFLSFISSLTGVSGLITDPYYRGGGLHEIAPGGHLDIHADFNLHDIMHVERRVNILIYLNRDWKAEWGGDLELWDDALTKRMHAIDPLFNRCVIFNTGSNTMHGNPNVVQTPDGRSRKSMALYYYTASWDETKEAHKTKFPLHKRHSLKAMLWRLRESLRKRLRSRSV